MTRWMFKIKECREFHRITNVKKNTCASGRLMEEVAAGADSTSIVNETNKTSRAIEKCDNLADS